MSGEARLRLWAPLRTAADLRAWVAEAEPGDSVEYHGGVLGRDRQTSPERSRIARLADEALSLFGEGSVHLVQQRIGRGRFSYLAIRRFR